MAKKFELKVEQYNNNIYFISKGYDKHYLCFDNCDSVNGIVLFSILMFNKFSLIMDYVDVMFWNDVVAFLNRELHLNKDVEIISKHETKIVHRKFSPEKILMFTGGKDSTYAKQLDPSLKIGQFHAQAYKTEIDKNAHYKFSSNIDNELWHSNRELAEKMRLEIMLPIISKYRTTYMGIEKEAWKFSKWYSGVDFNEWQKLLQKYELVFDSNIKNIWSEEIVRVLNQLNIPFVKCNYGTARTNNRSRGYLDGSDFCYDCLRCTILYAMGCNKETHGFDRDFYRKELRSVVSVNVKTFQDYITERVNSKKWTFERLLLLTEIAKEFGTLDVTL